MNNDDIAALYRELAKLQADAESPLDKAAIASITILYGKLSEIEAKIGNVDELRQQLDDLNRTFEDYITARASGESQFVNELKSNRGRGK